VNELILDGEKKKEFVVSPMPKAGSPPTKSGGWPINGAMTRTIMFQSLFSVNGITGCTLRMN
jgi:hypothetical protein